MNRYVLRSAVRSCATVGAASLIVFAGVGSAQAQPWDISGKIPPSKTKKPKKNDRNCLESYANDKPKAGDPILFSVQPGLTGDVGDGSTTPLIAEDPAKRDAALAQLRGDKKLKVRLNRVFMREGSAGLQKFKALAEYYAERGYDIEVQIRYQPADGDNGDMKKWLRFVRSAVKTFGPNKRVKDLQIANEVNLTFTPNTSDGFYEKAVDAMVLGTIEADRVSRKLGYKHQKFGFNYFWRLPYAPDDGDYWRKIRKIGGKKIVKATDWIGVDMYPGTFMPGLMKSAPIVDISDVILEGLAQTRECYMKMAGFTMKTPLHIHEAAYPTGPQHTEEDQNKAVNAFVTTAHKYRGRYNIKELMWFNLRDNNSAGPDYQSYFGLLKDDYTPKPSFETYRQLVAKYGAK